MRKPTYPIIVIALGTALVAASSYAIAQQAIDQQHQRSGTMHRPTVTPRERVQTLRPPRVRPSPHGARLTHGPLPSHNFGGHIYRGNLAWEHGRWHHQMRNGRYGWWWDVGGLWYFYPQQIEGPPDYVSDIEVEDEATGAPPPSAPPKEARHTFYYRPGDLKGVPYNMFEECSQARQEAGDIGVCVNK